MWSLVILILNLMPPQGMVLGGFADQASCQEEARRMCNGEPGWRCKCILYDPADQGATK